MIQEIIDSLFNKKPSGGKPMSGGQDASQQMGMPTVDSFMGPPPIEKNGGMDLGKILSALLGGG